MTWWRKQDNTFLTMPCARAAVRGTKFSRLRGDGGMSAEHLGLTLAVFARDVSPTPISWRKSSFRRTRLKARTLQSTSVLFGSRARTSLPVTSAPALFQEQQLPGCRRLGNMNWVFFPNWGGTSRPRPCPRAPAPEAYS